MDEANDIIMQDAATTPSPLSSPQHQHKHRHQILEYKVTDPQGNTVTKRIERSPDVSPLPSSPQPTQILKPSAPTLPRQKVALEKGHGMKDWYGKLATEGEALVHHHSPSPSSSSSSAGHSQHKTSSSPSHQRPPGSGGGIRMIPMSEVRKHNTVDDCWTVLRGRVYDISSFMRYHPGGVEKLMLGAGRDCTAIYDKYHAWVNSEFLIGKLYIGELAPEQPGADAGGGSGSGRIRSRPGKPRAEALEEKKQDLLLHRMKSSSAAAAHEASAASSAQR